MPDNEQVPSPGTKSDVWDYVRRRNELDREIQEKFAKPVTVMFTDIKGSTTFFDMRGDLEGVTMLQRHNDLVLPPIAARVVTASADHTTAAHSAAATRPGIVRVFMRHIMPEPGGRSSANSRKFDDAGAKIGR